MFIRRRFSGSNFLREVREHHATCFIYIGELCRYLLNVPAQPDDHNTPLTRMMGNGLRPDVWHEFKSRFGLERIAEFYGSSEGNVAFVNMLNKDCTVGTTSVPIALVKYDVHADEIVFNTGDLMKTVDVGFSLGLPHFQFVDRVGDTFRWKSENVSTNEVGEVINAHAQIDFCNVYGVEIPKADGRAGMASMVLTEGLDTLDIESFSNYVNSHLPAYARPVFLRIQSELDTTGTFKMLKGELRKEAYDLDQVSDTIFVLKPRSDTYVRLEEDFAAILKAGDAGY